jgi:hypothetical protein
MSTPEYAEIDFTYPESLSSIDPLVFELFAEAFCSLAYTKEDLVEYIQKNGFNAESLLNELVLRYNSEKGSFYGISTDLVPAIRLFAAYEGGFTPEDVAYLGDDEDYVLDEFKTFMTEKDEEDFLDFVGDKVRYIDCVTQICFEEWLTDNPEMIGLEGDEADDPSDHIQEWYYDLSDRKLVPMLIEIKKQFEQHQQKKA